MPSVSTIVKPYSSNSNYDDEKLKLVDR
jgi:hypothetical protein